MFEFRATSLSVDAVISAAHTVAVDVSFASGELWLGERVVLLRTGDRVRFFASRHSAAQWIACAARYRLPGAEPRRLPKRFLEVFAAALSARFAAAERKAAAGGEDLSRGVVEFTSELASRLALPARITAHRAAITMAEWLDPAPGGALEAAFRLLVAAVGIAPERLGCVRIRRCGKRVFEFTPNTRSDDDVCVFVAALASRVPLPATISAADAACLARDALPRARGRPDLLAAHLLARAGSIPSERLGGVSVRRIASQRFALSWRSK